MIDYSQNRAKRPYRPFVALVYAFILLFGISFGSFGILPWLNPKTAEATNPYISNIQFYTDANGFARVKFFVNTSFDIDVGVEAESATDYSYCVIENGYNMGKVFRDTEIIRGGFSILLTDSEYRGDIYCNSTMNFIAGNTYDTFLIPGGLTISMFNTATKILCIFDNCDRPFNADLQSYLQSQYGESITQSFYITDFGYTGYPDHWPFQDTEKYYFSETPTLNITFPLPNAEIAEAFDITGTYTIPSLDDYYILGFEFQYEDADMIWDYHTDFLTATTGSFSVRITALPRGNYTIRPHFFGAIGWYYTDEISISIVEVLPIELPDTQETPLEQFGVIRGSVLYPTISDYDEPTALYNNLVSALEPIFIVIGENLTFFSSRFNQDTAKETGEKTGQAILLMRAYSSNLNTFFSDLPVSEFLFFYLTLLVVVIVFRVIKNLINLIKP